MNITRLVKLSILVILSILVSCDKEKDLEENAVIRFSESSIDFGDITTGDETAKNFEIINTGNVDLIITDFTIPDNFSLNVDSATIAPNETLEIKITFKPTVVYEYNGELTITSNASSGINTLTIIGSGVCNIFNGNVTLQTQQQVDDFTASNCTKILGYLLIGNFSLEPNDINNLDGLSSITEIDGFLEISGTALTNLRGLNNLNSIGENLNILNNSSLANFDGLNQLKSIGQPLIIIDNDALANIDGLSSLNSIGGNLLITNNGVLTNLDGLSNLASISDRLFNIVENDALKNLCGISQLIINGSISEAEYLVSSNDYNPTYEQIQNSGSGGCEQ